ncbi:transcriptional regulator [Caulobacter sp. AP07]|uniref:MarR family transcriptional regulator n=1 Tax=Caulobacter sp. AP07 TaxID=1144304 RepID=UPI000271ED65|nr:MarR family transcriptional regulator [Caulobacter sp. AP07]EJL35872.1 transcriptional regulator [Caulobacter sp. AP07]
MPDDMKLEDVADPAYSPGLFDESLPVILLRARIAVTACFRPVLTQHELTDAQWRVIKVLAGSGPMDVSELSRRTDLLAPSISRIVRDLGVRGVTSRTTPPQDARRSIVGLTDQGEALVDKLQKAVTPIHHHLDGLLGEDKKDLKRILARLTAALSASLPEGWQQGEE